MTQCSECSSENIETKPPENCSCHINPPCSSCTDAPLVCCDCGHEEKPELYTPKMPDNYVPPVYKSNAQRLSEMDGSKLDWIYIPHTHFTMIKKGRYPVEMTRPEVEKEVTGTFGGRFNLFQDGHFEYVAYTD
jgi:hypothetical protein